MRVFVAGASGAMGSRLVPQLIDAGHEVIVMATQVRGASNAKAKRELGWTPRYPSWRPGFPMTYSAITVADGSRPA